MPIALSCGANATSLEYRNSCTACIDIAMNGIRKITVPNGQVYLISVTVPIFTVLPYRL